MKVRMDNPYKIFIALSYILYEKFILWWPYFIKWIVAIKKALMFSVPKKEWVYFINEVLLAARPALLRLARTRPALFTRPTLARPTLTRPALARPALAWLARARPALTRPTWGACWHTANGCIGGRTRWIFLVIIRFIYFWAVPFRSLVIIIIIHDIILLFLC